MTLWQAIRHLYKDGGIPRFYQGLSAALVQGPASRFGDTAANTGILTLLDSFDETKKLPVRPHTRMWTTLGEGQGTECCGKWVSVLSDGSLLVDLRILTRALCVCACSSVCVQSYVKTMAASLTAASWRIFLMPLDVRKKSYICYIILLFIIHR